MLKSSARGYLLRLRFGETMLDDGAVQRAGAALGDRGRLQRVGVDGEHFRLDLAEHAVLGEVLADISATGAIVLDCAQQRSELEESFLRLTTARV
jgi:hypothetical protein